MPTLISADDFRERFDIDSDIESKRIEPHIGSASRRLRKWVSDEIYAATIAAAAASSPTDEQVEQVNDLQNAEAHLAYHFAIAGFNSPLSGKGVVATSMSSEGKEMRKYLTPKETAELAANFLELARELAEPYIADTGESGVQTVISLDCDLEATWLPT